MEEIGHAAAMKNLYEAKSLPMVRRPPQINLDPVKGKGKRPAGPVPKKKDFIKEHEAFMKKTFGPDFDNGAAATESNGADEVGAAGGGNGAAGAATGGNGGGPKWAPIAIVVGVFTLGLFLVGKVGSAAK